MRALRNILLGVLAIGLAGCGSSRWTETPLRTADGDWLQQGGGASRTSAVVRTQETAPHTDDGDAWEFSLDGTGGSAGPLLTGDLLLFSSISASVEAVHLSDADKRGEVNCTWFIEGTPAVMDGLLFVATVGSESPVFCFDLRDGSMRWSRVFEPVNAALCAHDGAVYAAGLRGGVARFDPADSVEAWRVTLSGAVRAAPAAADTVLVVGTEAGDLYGLSTRSGREIWRVPTFAAIQAGPVVTGRRIIASNRAGTVTAVDMHSGTKAWELETGTPVYYTPAARGDSVLIPLSSGMLLLIDARDGRVLREYELGELPGASPLFGPGHAWQLARKGALYRLDLASGEWALLHSLSARSETPPLMTPRGILLVDESGEAIMVDTK